MVAPDRRVRCARRYRRGGRRGAHRVPARRRFADPETRFCAKTRRAGVRPMRKQSRRQRTARGRAARGRGRGRGVPINTSRPCWFRTKPGVLSRVRACFPAAVSTLNSLAVGPTEGSQRCLPHHHHGEGDERAYEQLMQAAQQACLRVEGARCSPTSQRRRAPAGAVQGRRARDGRDGADRLVDVFRRRCVDVTVNPRRFWRSRATSRSSRRWMRLLADYGIRRWLAPARRAWIACRHVNRRRQAFRSTLWQRGLRMLGDTVIAQATYLGTCPAGDPSCFAREARQGKCGKLYTWYRRNRQYADMVWRRTQYVPVLAKKTRRTTKMA